ncbi:LOW QUALITY PROTEIN: vitelline membrane outer layer protein 1 homolog [Glossophaga mutica]
MGRPPPPPQGIPGNYTAMNGIRLHCAGGNAEQHSVVESQSGRGGAGANDPLGWGAWSKLPRCPTGRCRVAFSFLVEAPTTPGDNMAANNARLRCSDGAELEGPGLAWGDNWSEPRPKGICGSQIKIEPPTGLRDDTAVNDVRFFLLSPWTPSLPSPWPHFWLIPPPAAKASLSWLWSRFRDRKLCLLVFLLT